MPSASDSVTIRAGTRQVFSILDNVEVTPSWLDRCTRMERLTPGSTVVGTRLGYAFADGPRPGFMEGVVIARVPGRRLTHAFTGRFTDVTVDVRLEPGPPEAGADEVTRVTHTLTITPKGLGQVLLPLLRRSVPRQVPASLAALRRLAED